MRYMLILLGLMFAGVANAMDCEKVPDCENLGYSTKDDPNCAEDGYMYCPFDKEYKACVQSNCAALGFTESDKSSWCGKIVKCKGNEKFTACKALCEIGDVYYADGSCGLAEDFNPHLGKIPVGVIYYVTDGGYHGRVLNLYPLTADNNGNFDPAHPYDRSKEELYWGLFETDVSGLKNYPTMTVTDDFDQAQEETQIAAGASSTKPECLNRTYQEHTEEYNQYCQATAAKATLAFYPPDVSPENNIVGQGRWFMPTFADLFYMQGFDAEKVLPNQFDKSGIIGDIREKLNETFSLLESKGVKVKGLVGYWQGITEGSSMLVYSMNMDAGTKNNHHKNNPFQTRAILAF